MKFGIIGTGMIAGFHAEAIKAMAGGTLHSVYGRRPQAVHEFTGKYPVKGFTDLAEFLADPELEIVTITTPSGAHLEPAIAAAQAGKHVLVEKPMEVTVARVDQIIDACDRAEVMLAGIFNRRFSPAMEACKRAVEEGRFGTLVMADAYVKWYRDQAYYDSGAWRGTRDLDGGGAFMNQGIHAIDQLLYLAGEVQSVCANMGCLIHSGIEVEDTGVALLEFRNGARGVIQCSTACWSRAGHPAEVHLCGECGSAILTDETLRVWEFQESAPMDLDVKSTLMREKSVAGLGANDPKAIHFVGHQRNFEDFVDAIREGRDPLVSPVEARRAVELICAIYQSAQNGSARVDL